MSKLKSEDILWTDIEPLEEMANSRSSALKELHNLSTEIAFHLFKYFYMPNHSASNHWKRELEVWRRRLFEFNKSKMRSDNYDRSILMLKIWGGPLSLPKDRQGKRDWLSNDGFKHDLEDVDTEESAKEFKIFVMSYVDAILDPTIKPNY